MKELLQQSLDVFEGAYRDVLLRDAIPSAKLLAIIAALREALAAPMPGPVGKVLAEGEMIGYDRRGGDVIWWNKPPGPALIYAAPPAAPADMVMVPREPTPEMLFAGHMKIDFDRSDQNTYEMTHESQTRYSGTSIETDMRDCWAAMIAAAPPAAPAVPLTDEQIASIVYEMNGNEPTAPFWRDLARAIEKAHGIGGGNG